MDKNRYKPQISVIVIGYNVERYISRCLKSVFNQSYTNYEILFVNDGSVDHTLEVANGFLDSHTNFRILNKENGGIISARKMGVEYSNGDYIVFIDGDDYVEPDMLQQLYSVAYNTDADMVIPDYWEERLQQKWIRKKCLVPYGILEGEFYLQNILTDKIIHFAVGKLIKKELITSIGYSRFPNLSIAEDLLLNVMIGIAKPKVYYINHASYHYRYNENSVTRNENTHIINEHISALSYIIKGLKKEFGKKYAYYIQYQWYLFAFWYIQTRCSFAFKKYLINQCKRHLCGIGRNPLYKEQNMDLSCIYGRVLIFLYLFFPGLAFVLDKLSKRVIDLFRTLGILKKY